ncbi:ABC transporter ATP-binding protein [Modestobacter sp. VKM Ac-2979]|uniref:ABC transporter ATP-binding protein n=1 Tax=unclassified Modestobacter TaxID=2643866 RepID=UPI0022AB5E63|nr:MULTISPECIES: ABC transporter ATP-binding protein [unclassified Modestobacter]MCZ2812013.1 ABC transporter ATP-binding protein [Modestobacter sp. VKM Ac-2979]MCZ2843737.1 ABC transporter ATP-binding protein [Modestobacter sp. VKM Ac-2980]
MTTVIEGHALTFAYGATTVVRDVDVLARTGRVLGLLGPNGSGKTTVVRMLSGIVPPGRGKVLLDGHPLAAMTRRATAQQIAVVLQESAGDLPITVADMVLLGRAPHRSTFSGNRAEDHRIAASTLRRVGARQLADRAFAGLSGGEKQRVLIARALAQQPTHLVLDEPTNHLDIRYQHELLRTVRGLGVTTVIVLHDLNLAARYCDDVLVLNRGAVVAHGPCGEVLTPELLESVYGVGVERLDTSRGLQFLFHPFDAHDPRREAPTPDPAMR